MDRRVLRSPFKLGEIIDGVFRLYRKDFKKLWLFAIIANIVLSGWIKWWQFQEMEPGGIPIESYEWFRLLWIQLGVSAFFYFPLLQNLAFQMSNRQLSSTDEDRTISWKQLFLISFRNLGKVFIVQGLLTILLLSIFLLLGSLIFSQSNSGTVVERIMSASMSSLFLFFPLISYLAIRFSLLIPIISTENIGIFQAFKRSWWLTRGRFWAILGRLFLLTLSIFPFYMSSSMLANVSFVPVEQEGSFGIMIFLMDLLLVPLFDWIFPFFFCLVYWDERMRKEAVDLFESVAGHQSK